MRLWRISEWATLDGVGGLKVGGRWHHKGRPVVYMADASALALLEVLVRQQRAERPAPYQLLEIRAPDDLEVTVWPDGSDHKDPSLTAAWGDAFLGAGRAALARVPSVIAPGGCNYLLNPLHAAADLVQVVQTGRWPWDARLFGGR